MAEQHGAGKGQTSITVATRREEKEEEVTVSITSSIRILSSPKHTNEILTGLPLIFELHTFCI